MSQPLPTSGFKWMKDLTVKGVIDICDPPQEFDAKGESTRTTRLHDTLSVP